MVWPAVTSSGPLPHRLMLPDIARDFNEVAAIVSLPPRGAAALLRLALEKLTVILEPSEKDINRRIQRLVERGLPKMVQQALDAIRVIGNEAVHPGVMDLADDEETARTLFDLMNDICEFVLTREERIKTVYVSIPESKRNGIQQRDRKQLAPPDTKID